MKMLISFLILLVAALRSLSAIAQQTEVSVDLSAPGADKAWSFSNGEWTIEDGVLIQSDPNGGAQAFLTTQAWSDARLTVKFKAFSEGKGVKAAGLILRSTDSRSYYGIHYDTKNNQVILFAGTHQSSWAEIKRRGGLRMDENKWYTASVAVTGKHLSIYLDDSLVLEADAEVYSAGVVGLYTSQGHIAFRDIGIEGAPAALDEKWRIIPPMYQIICKDAGAGGYEAFPDLCRLKNGDLLCVFYAGYAHVSRPNENLPKGGRCSAVRSSDNGRTWSEPFIVCDTPADDRDPHIAQLSDGTLMCDFFSYYVGAKRRDGAKHDVEIVTVTSTDNGQTWSEPNRLKLDSPLAYACSAPVRELPDGSLILGIYHESPRDNVAFGGTIKSYDKGKTWTDLVHIGEGAGVYLDAETDTVRLSDGRLFAALRSSKQEMHYAISNDNGKTWGPIKSFGFKGHCPYLLMTSKGILLVAHRVPSTSLHYSLDEGKTWSENVLIDTVGGAYPSMVELDDGTIYCVYYEEGAGSSIRAKRFRVSKEGVEFISPG